MHTRLWIRAGLILLTVVDLVLGFWAYLFPHSFYTGVPTVAADPPFSEHLMTDVGAFFIAQGVVMAAAAISMARSLVCGALAGYLTFSALHLVFHASHLAGMPPADAAGLVTALSLDVVLPALLLAAAGLPVALRRGHQLGRGSGWPAGAHRARRAHSQPPAALWRSGPPLLPSRVWLCDGICAGAAQSHWRQPAR